MTDSGIAGKIRRAGLSPPQVLTIAVTGACNLRCAHCWVDAGTPGASDSVPEAMIRRVIEEFAILGGSGVRLTGGELLCHPGWRSLVQSARQAGYSQIALQTNAMLFSEEDTAWLRDLDFPGLSIQVSLDGARSASHDRIRGDGAFSRALTGIRRLVRAGLGRRISIFFTEMRHNLEELPDLLELADTEGIGSVAAGTLVRCGRAEGENEIAPPEPEQYLRLLERYDNDPRFRELYARLGSVAALEWGTAAPHRGECCALVETPYLTPGGRLYPCLMCHADDFSVSGVFQKDLAAALEEGIPLWSSLLEISRRRTTELKECRQCPEKSICGGGCMGRAWGSFGDLTAADDRCGLRQALRQRRHAPA